MLIFAEKQTDVDDVHEYLMSKDVDAVAVHGQEDAGGESRGH